MEHYDIIIVGAGLAGLTAAIHLARDKHRVLVFEKNTFPHHKVCGEYVSNEVRPYLESLGVCLPKAIVNIDTLTVSTLGGKSVTTKLPLGGFGISRFTFDDILYEQAIGMGVNFLFQTVDQIEYHDQNFSVTTAEGEKFNSSFVIGAFGKRSMLDKKLNRSFAAKKSPWLAVKMHYRYPDFPDNEVALHNFSGGYGGLSRTDTGAVNFCYLASYQSFQKEKNIESFNTNVVRQNPFLKIFLKDAEPIFDEPLSIAQISFEPKKAVENHVLMCGDSAGLIHPLCGNGMAMAIRSAKIGASLVHHYLAEAGTDRKTLESKYSVQWNHSFKKRLWMGRQLQSLLLNHRISNLGISAVVKAPLALRQLIRTTHGKSIL